MSVFVFIIRIYVARPICRFAARAMADYTIIPLGLWYKIIRLFAAKKMFCGSLAKTAINRTMR